MRADPTYDPDGFVNAAPRKMAKVGTYAYESAPVLKDAKRTKKIAKKQRAVK